MPCRRWPSLPGSWAIALGWALTAVDGFVLVYLGEHYVIDLITGLVLAELI